MARSLEIGSLLYEGVDQIDLTGPFEILSRLPDSAFAIYGEEAGPVRDVNGLRLLPDALLEDATFRTGRPWGARDLLEINGVGVRLHWTDQPYHWHVDDGAEAFIVLDGAVDMRFRQDGQEQCVRLKPSDIFLADIGDAHVAHPVGEARIRVVERKGSI